MITVRLDGVEETADALRDVAPTLARIDQSDVAPSILQTMARRAFASGGSELYTGAGRWRQITPRWRAWKASHGRGSRILVDRGNLEAEMTRLRGGILDVSPDEIRWGSRRRSAAIQQRAGRDVAQISRAAELALADGLADEAEADLVRVLR